MLYPHALTYACARICAYTHTHTHTHTKPVTCTRTIRVFVRLSITRVVFSSPVYTWCIQKIIFPPSLQRRKTTVIIILVCISYTSSFFILHIINCVDNRSVIYMIYQIVSADTTKDAVYCQNDSNGSNDSKFILMSPQVTGYWRITTLNILTNNYTVFQKWNRNLQYNS